MALRRIALGQLSGVGDRRLGEWEEQWMAYHVRRRLSAEEQQLVGDVVDIRRTPEAVERAARCGAMLRFASPEILADEVG
jgi:hypothetical protein